MHERVRLDYAEVRALCAQVLVNSGASEVNAESVARSLVQAEAEGVSSVGLAHLVDYREGLIHGRILGQASPRWCEGQALLVDGGGGFAHPAFDFAEARFFQRAREQGVAILSIGQVFTCGVVGHFVERMAEAGFVGLAFGNAPAMMAPHGGRGAFFGTNPMAFAVPCEDGLHCVIDQSSSSSAFVNIRRAAERDEPLPEGWALDADGQPTTDPARALGGGTIAPSGGHKGNNLALMVELLAAGLCAANWSHQAPSFTEGKSPLNVGQAFIAIDPSTFQADFSQRVSALLNTYRDEFAGYIPGDQRVRRRQRAQAEGLWVRPDWLAGARAWCG